MESSLIWDNLSTIFTLVGMLACSALISPCTPGLLEMTITISAHVPLLGSTVASIRDCKIIIFLKCSLCYKEYQQSMHLFIFRKCTAHIVFKEKSVSECFLYQAVLAIRNQ